MTDRLTDEQVARMSERPAGPEHGYRWSDASVMRLASEVQEYRALRPTCPTCDGSGTVFRWNG